VTEQHVSEQYDEAAVDESVEPATESADLVEDAAPEAEPDEAAADAVVDDASDEDAAVEAEAPVEEPVEPVEADDAEAEGEDPLEEFRKALWAKPGDWYVIHTYSGMENRVKANLENRIISLNMEDYIHEIVVPIE
jgi:transcriptional antiterminator NusG